MNKAIWFGLIIGVVVIVGGAVFLHRYQQQQIDDAADALALLAPPPAAPVAPSDPAEPAPEAAEPPIQHPVPEPVAGDAPLPELDDSDAAAIASLRELFGPEPVESFLVPKEVIRRLVLTVDSMDREPLPLWLRPIRRVPGAFEVQGEGPTLAIKPDNTRRYDRLARALQAVDTARLTAAYKRYYPLFQDAYDTLGNPRTRYFNDRLVQVIDHLVETPAVDEPLALVRPKVLFLYADPELEALSSGQKLLLRLGRDHAAMVKRKLSEIRSQIAGARPAAG